MVGGCVCWTDGLDVTAVVAMARLSGDEVSANGETQRLVGKVVAGNFRLLREIGAGGMGRVYEAEQLSLRKPVAVKILHRDLMSDATVVRRFEREARSAAQIEHPNLVRIIDLGEDKETGLLFIAMELVKGRDLGRVIEEDGPLSLDRIVRIMSQVLSALEEAHGHGIIHRDLKPANIMLVERRQADEQVRVCDFGIAKSTMPGPSRADSMLTVRGLVCGTPEYMAPEQARGEDVDGRTDLYAAGVIMHQLLTGEVPFRASSPVGILSMHLDHSPPSARLKRPDLPVRLESLILKALEKDPRRRPQSARAFRNELQEAYPPTTTPTDENPQTPTSSTSAVGATVHGSSWAVPAVVPAKAPRIESSAHTVPAVAGPRAPAEIPDAARIRGRGWRRLGFSAGLALGGIAAFIHVASRADTWLPAPPGSPIATVPAATPRAEPPPRRSWAAESTLETSEDAKSTWEGAAVVPVSTNQSGDRTGPDEGADGTRQRSDGRAAGSTRVDGVSRRRGEKDRHPQAATSRHAGANGALAAPMASRKAAGAAAVPAGTVAAATSVGSPGQISAAGAGAPVHGRTVHETLADAERLLAQGEVTEACARADEARQLSPRTAAVYRLLGKCYMRAGKADRAAGFYRIYLELEPDAPDAAFIRGIAR